MYIGNIMLKYRNNWIQRADRMQRGRFPKLLKNFKPQGLGNRKCKNI